MRVQLIGGCDMEKVAAVLVASSFMVMMLLVCVLFGRMVIDVIRVANVWGAIELGIIICIVVSLLMLLCSARR